MAVAPEGIEVAVFDGLRDLPFFNPDVEADGPAPASVQTWLIATPEYGFSLPGALKNAIDWVIGSGELERKVVAVTASTNHPERGLRGLAALRDTLGAVSANIVGGEPIVRGPMFDREVGALLGALAGAVRAAKG